MSLYFPSVNVKNPVIQGTVAAGGQGDITAPSQLTVGATGAHAPSSTIKDTGNSGSLAGSLGSSDSASRLYALIIGIDDYSKGTIRNLRGAKADANAMQAYLTRYLHVPDNQIINLRDAEASRKTILYAFDFMTADIETPNDETHSLAGVGSPSLAHVGSPNLTAFTSKVRPQKGDPILIYYAGHGATAPAPEKWEAGGMKIQLIVPHDCTNEVIESDQVLLKAVVDGQETERGSASVGSVDAIPDRVLNILLQRLADKKGDNITVVFDCCHSESGTRASGEQDPQYLERGLTIKGGLPENIDENIGKLGTKDHSLDFTYAGLNSHVLLAACTAMETAREFNGRGLFTKELIGVLEQTTDITYDDLIKRIGTLPKSQNPQCEGKNSGRKLFLGHATNQRSSMHSVRKEGVKYIMDAGDVHGITNGSQFAIYVYAGSQDSPTRQFLGTLMAVESNIEMSRTYLTPLPDGPKELDIRPGSSAFALESLAGEEKRAPFHVYIHAPGKSDSSKTLLDTICGYTKDPQLKKYSTRLVDTKEADVEVVVKDGKVTFLVSGSTTGEVLGFTGMRMEHTIESNGAGTNGILGHIMQGSAKYFWHLNRKPTKGRGTLSDRVTMDFMVVKDMGDVDQDTLNPILVPLTGKNLIEESITRVGVQGKVDVQGRVDVQADDGDTLYAIKLSSKATFPLYAYLFYFDSRDLSIAQLYKPSVGGGHAAASIGTAGSLCLGYGDGGIPPFKYFLEDGQTSPDVGFLKLFLSTNDVDLSSIAQESPFENIETRKMGPALDVSGPVALWDTKTIVVVQHPRGWKRADPVISPSSTATATLSNDTLHETATQESCRCCIC